MHALVDQNAIAVHVLEFCGLRCCSIEGVQLIADNTVSGGYGWWDRRYRGSAVSRSVT